VTEQSIQPPRIPRRLDTLVIDSLEDHAEHYSISLSGLDLSGQTAHGLTIEEARIQRVSFAETRLNRVRVMDADVQRADFSGAVWDAARVVRATIRDSRLIGMHLVDAELQEVRFVECVMTGGIFVGLSCDHVAFDRCILREASFESANLNGVDFRECDLSGADLRGAKLDGADLRGANLSEVQVGSGEMRGAVIDPSQAAQVVSLIGVEVKDWGDGLGDHS
jgi:uncharacterized protein YjbI with pentapeptide repeats